MRRDARRDANEKSIVAALRSAGCDVTSLVEGDGVPDLLVWSPMRACWVLLEVKDPKQPPSKRALKPAQKLFFAAHGDARQAHCLFVVETVAEALAAVRPLP